MKVAIPSNRVNVSYEEDNPAEGPWQGPHVAIPSNRVNVSYLDDCIKLFNGETNVAIPSNRVNVSYIDEIKKAKKAIPKSQSPQIGSMFLTRRI